MTDTPLIRVENLSVSFGAGAREVKAVRNISFDIGKAETVALVGESGSGKTTLLSLLGALDRPTSGSIEVAGQRFEETTTRAARMD